MALPDRLPEPPDDFEDNASSVRPHWLVGAEEGAQAEVHGLERSEVKLIRPVAPTPPAGTPANAPAKPAVPAKPVAWTAAGNSLPRLTAVPEPARRPDPEDAAEFDPTLEGPGDLPRGVPQVASVAPATRALEEPWWLVLGERFGSDRRLQIGIAAALVVVLAVVFWPRGTAGVSLKEIRRNPDRWEGQSVNVSGRVGDVFPLGSGYVFNLHQGRDTIVVFTRTRQPERRARIQVTGEVSAGYLDGRARLAILEQPTPPTP
jgi:hypothetical protein